MRNINRNFNKFTPGVSRTEAEEALKLFLSTKSNIRVFSLKGDWGIGKTHLIKEFLAKEKQDYHYASAFGLSTIDEIKFQLWSNFQINSGQKNSDNKKFNIRSLLKITNKNSQQIGSLLGAIPKVREFGSGFTPALIALTSNLIISSFLKGKLICIDDLERRSKKLPLIELLGFIERLSEEKECKVVLIYNESKFERDEEDRNIFKEYREKVIDYEVKLDPAKIENFYIGFGLSDPDEDIILKYLENEYIQTNNIRILRKLRWNLSRVREHIGNPLRRVKEQIIKETIFILLSKFDSNFPVKLEELIPLGDFSNVLASKSQKNEELYLLANKLGYTDSEISKQIIRLIETSICDFQKIRDEVNRLNEREIKHKIKEKLHKAYEPYSDSFNDSQDELQRNLTRFLDENAPFLDIREFRDLESISSLVGLDLQPYKEAWIKNKINTSTTLDEFYTLRSILQENSNLAEGYIMNEINDKIQFLEQDINIDIILTKALNNKSWSEKDSRYLNERTLEQCTQWLLEKHPDKVFLVRQGLRMEEIFSKTLEKSISELAKKNKLNATRAEKLYGINVRETISEQV